MNVKHGTLAVPGDPTPWVTVSPNEDKTWCVLWLQGWTSTIDGHLAGITRMAEASGVTFAMLDYAGHGSHPVRLEDSTKQQQFNECLAAYDELVSRGHKNIIVIGGSFGGYMAALVTGARTPAAIVLRAPAIYRDEEFELAFAKTALWDDTQDSDRLFRENITKNSRMNAIASVRAYDNQVWVMEHELDTVIPKSVPVAYFEAAKRSNYLVVPNTEHSPKTMPNPVKHFAYIEHLLVSIVKAVRLAP
jgi:esterase/lipase